MVAFKVGLVWYPVSTLGYGKRLGVWFQGCKKRCRNCISPEFQGQEGGREAVAESILDAFCENMKPDGLTISGGEPFDQPEALLELVVAYKKRFNDDILIFTGYTLEELHEKKSLAVEGILKNIAVLIDGSYVEEQNNGVGLRGSSNQKIYVWKYKERYENAEAFTRRMQCVLLKENLLMIGIPPK